MALSMTVEYLEALEQAVVTLKERVAELEVEKGEARRLLRKWANHKSNQFACNYDQQVMQETHAFLGDTIEADDGRIRNQAVGS